MIRTFCRIATWAALAAPLLAGEGGPKLTAPELGYVFDESAQAIRVIAGVPGAAVLAGGVDAGGAVTAAVVHSASRSAVARIKDGAWVVVALGAGHPAVLDTTLEEVRTAVFSRSGEWVALHDGHTAELYSLRAGTAARTGRHHPDAGIAHLAVNDAGELALATQSGLILRTAGEETRALAAGGNWTAVTFAADGHDIYAADAEPAELVRITPEGGRTRVAALPAAAQAIAVSADGSQAAVVMGSMAGIVHGGQVAALDCHCAPSGFQSLTGDLVVHLSGTNLVLDGADGPRLTTVTGMVGGNAQ